MGPLENNLKASIIIPTKDKISRLRLVLYALALQINEDHEVIIVMDGCNQDTLTEFRKIELPFQPVLVILDHSGGRAAARNHGIRKASGDILIFMDDDRIPGPHFIEGHIAVHQKKRCMVLGKRMQLFLTEEFITTLGHFGNFNQCLESVLLVAKPDVTWLKNKIYLLRFSPVPWLACVTSNLSVRKNDMHETGMFDENYAGWGWEDSDLGYRFLKNKIKMIKNASVINYHLVHPKPKNLHQEEFNNYQYFYTKAKGDHITRFSLIIIRLIRDIGFLFQKLMKRYQE